MKKRLIILVSKYLLQNTVNIWCRINVCITGNRVSCFWIINTKTVTHSEFMTLQHIKSMHIWHGDF